MICLRVLSLITEADLNYGYCFRDPINTQPVEWNPVCETEVADMTVNMDARVTHPTDDLTQPYEDFKRVPHGNVDEQSLKSEDNDKSEKRSSGVESCSEKACKKLLNMKTLMLLLIPKNLKSMRK